MYSENPLYSIGPSGIGGPYQKEPREKIDKNTPEERLDRILGLQQVIERIVQAIQKHRV